MKLSDFYGEGKDIEILSPHNVDDVIWQAKNAGATKLTCKPNELNPIWLFLSANIAENDIEMRRLYFVEGRCSRILGIDIDVEYSPT